MSTAASRPQYGAISGQKGVVYYRFRHQAALEKIEFEASEISVSEMKTKISEKTLCNRYDIKLFALAQSTAASGTPLELISHEFVYDSELIPSNTNVLVIRAPGQGPKGSAVASGEIVVKTAEFFIGKETVAVLEEELVERSLIPETAICPLCRWIMMDSLEPKTNTLPSSTPSKTPYLLPCCGGSLCSDCHAKFSSPAGCVVGGEGCATRPPIFNKPIHQQVAIILQRKDRYDWTAVASECIAQVFQEVKVAQGPAEPHPPTEDVFDLDAWDGKPKPAEIVDLESEKVEKRRKRVVKEEWSIKQQLKAEYTDEDLNKLFRGRAVAVPKLDVACVLTVDFPALLTPEQFEYWKIQENHGRE